MFKAKDIKKDFPILSREIGGEKLVYLDNGATTQKPNMVIDSIVDFYKNHNANVHRGIHTLSEEATDLYESARKVVANFINAKPEEIIFTKGSTESLNRVASTWCITNLKKGDVMLTTIAEHHSNIVTWQQVAKRTGAKLDFIRVTEGGELDISDLKEKMNDKVKFIAISHASNVLGTIFPVREVCKIAEKYNCVVSVDGAQGVPHLPTNVKSLGCDFYSFSGHKMLGPTGIGVLWIKEDILKNLSPYEFGGGMINKVDSIDATWAEIPERFEAGTPNICGAIGLASAINYLNNLGMDDVRKHEIEITKYALEEMERIDGLKILGPMDVDKRTGLISFTVGNLHGHDIAAVLNTKGIAVRSGHHCTMPLHKKMGIPASVRASFYVYNTKEDIDKLVNGIKYAIKILG